MLCACLPYLRTQLDWRGHFSSAPSILRFCVIKKRCTWRMGVFIRSGLGFLPGRWAIICGILFSMCLTSLSALFQMDQLFVHRHVPPTPRGLEATCQLEDFPFYSDYRPCGVDENDQYHYPSTVGGTCRRGFAVFSEVRCQVRLLMTYPCYYNSDSPPYPLWWSLA